MNMEEKIKKIISDILLIDSDDIREVLESNNALMQDVDDWLEKASTSQVRTGLEWVNTIDDACDKRYSEEYAHGEYCHEQSFKWGFQEGVDWLEKQGDQQSSTWSEEDEKMIDTIIYDLERHGGKEDSCYSAEITWLKSLKERYLNFMN